MGSVRVAEGIRVRKTTFGICWLVFFSLATVLGAQGPQPDEPRPRAVTPRQEEGEPKPFLASGPQELFARGVELADEGRVREALTLFKALTIAHPELTEPHVNLAALLAPSNSVAAADAAEAALLAHPICRAAFELRFLDSLGNHSLALLAGDARVPQSRAAPRSLAIAEPNSALPTYSAADPTPLTAASHSSSIDEAAAVDSLVAAWAAAWSARDAQDYLAFYAAEFQPLALSREAWEQQRRERLAGPKFVEITVSDLRIERLAAGRIAATFVQRYRSDRHQDQVRKTLIFVRRDGSWRIVRETSTKS